MREWESQSHVRWYCRYHVVIVPKYRRKSMFGALRKEIGPILKELCRRNGVELIEGHVMPDHVHMLLSIPPKFSVANIIGKLKGKSTYMNPPVLQANSKTMFIGLSCCRIFGVKAKLAP